MTHARKGLAAAVQEAEEMAREGRWTTEHVQRNQTACLTPSAGGCGR